MTPAEIITWAEQQDASGRKDAMGYPFTSWLLAVRNPDDSMLRDQNGRQVFQTQADFKRTNAKEAPTTTSTSQPTQQELFA